MERILKNWKAFINESKERLNELRYVHEMYLPEEFVASLPKNVQARIKKYGVLDFAFERYPKISSLGQKEFNKLKNAWHSRSEIFFVRYNNNYLLFDYHGKDDFEDVIRKPTEEEIRQRGKEIPILPDNWYEAYVLHYPDKELDYQTIDEKKKKLKRDLSKVKTLAVFDFDETLFHSDKAAERLPSDHPLSPDSLPDKAKKSDWNSDVVYKAQEMCANPTIYCVMMTGRVGDRFRDKIDNLLYDNNILFAETHYNEFGGDTVKYKIETVYQLIDKLPNVRNLIMWEDQKEKAEKYVEEFTDKINFKIHMVKKEKV